MPPKKFKKFPNRRLYNLDDCQYTNLSGVQKVVDNGHQIEVHTGKKGAERIITREVLLDVLKAKQLQKPTMDAAVLCRLIRTGA